VRNERGEGTGRGAAHPEIREYPSSNTFRELIKIKVRTDTYFYGRSSEADLDTRMSSCLN